MAKYICNGAQCICTMGTKEGTLEVKSQTKIFIQDKLMATENEKSFSLNFKLCNKSSPPTPCQPTIETPWTSTKSNVFQSDHKGLLEASTATCTFGKGEISIIDSKQAQTKNVIFGDYSSEPKEMSKVYAKVRTLASYKGEFGFDWVDVDPETMEIQKIQDVPFEEVEYFYKERTSTQDLGDIIPINQDKQGAIQAIQKNYDLINFSDYVDTPFVLLKPGEPATLSLEVFFEGESQEDYVSITGDEYYDFEITGGEKNGKTTKKKIIANEQLQLTINCSKESLDKKYFFLHTGAKGPREIGGLNMMKNKELKLKFRVIALVSNEGNPASKAKKLFQNFANVGVTEYLNKNSLNQAGYEVEIENQEMFANLSNPSVNLDDYFYAFNKEDWKSKDLFKENFVKVIETNGGSTVVKDVIVEGTIDYTIIDLYRDKLASKPGTSIYNEGIIILADYESPTSTVAFSRVLPLNHYAVFVYLNGIEIKENYSHEIGHMLGLSHLFYNLKEKEAYKTARENILGNGKPEFITINGKQIENPDCILSIDGQIQKSLTETRTYIREEVYAKKSTLLTQLRNSNTYFTTEKNIQQRNKTRIENLYRGQPNSVIVAGSGTNTQTKGEYLSICNKKILDYTKYTQENTSAINKLNSLNDNNQIKKHKYNVYFRASHYAAILRESKIYYYNIIKQIHNNSMFFKQGKTKNIMDYTNNKVFYLHNQIKIMRDDIQNY